MKNILSITKIIFWIILVFTYYNLFAAGLSSKAPLFGTWSWQNAWYIKFEFDYTANPSLFWQNVTVDASWNTPSYAFTWFAWSENVGWITFGGLWENWVKLQTTGNDNILTASWFAWGENVWWIKFNPTDDINSDVYLNKADNSFSWFAWSENVWWISMVWVKLDIVQPDINSIFTDTDCFNEGIFAANHNKYCTINFTDPSWPWYFYEIELSLSWSTSNNAYHSGASTITFYHDFSKAIEYNISIKDPSWNISSWKIKVVADKPDLTKSIVNLSFSWSPIPTKVADFSKEHLINIELKDQYWNPVINESWIKKVELFVNFSGTVKINQLWSQKLFTEISAEWDAIGYSWSALDIIWIRTWGSVNYFTWSNNNWTYNLWILSYTPTNNDNKLNLIKLSYKVSALWGKNLIWEVNETNIATNKDIKFEPLYKLNSIDNADNWKIIAWYRTSFTWSLSKSSSISVNDIQIANILDIWNNIMMSFQDSEVISWWSQVCQWFYKSYNFSSDNICDRSLSWSSNNVINIHNNNFSFSWIPKINIAAPHKNDIKYASEITYKMPDNKKVAYNLFSRTINSSATTWSDMGWVVNQSIKILNQWIISSNNIFNVLEGGSLNQIWKLTKPDVEKFIRDKAEGLIQWRTNYNNVNYTWAVLNWWNYTLNSWPSGKETIIIKWWDLVIKTDISKTNWKMKWIIVLKDWDIWWNVWIYNDVQNINAIIYADKNIISWNWNSYYTDNKESIDQLYIKWTLISNNTIWWASMIPKKCPFNIIETCTDAIAKRFDLNYFRFYIKNTATSPDTNWQWNPAVNMPSWWEDFPFVLEYDWDLIGNPPIWFK